MKRAALLLLLSGPACAEPLADSPRLTGIVVTPERRLALFEHAGETIYAEEGNAIGQYRVRTISRGQAALERDGQIVVFTPATAGTAPPQAGIGTDIGTGTGGVTFGLIVNPPHPAED